MATNNNSVPLGQAGTGRAFVLGQSQAANQFIDTQARNQQANYQAELAKQKQAQESAKLYQDNLLKLKGGLLWQNDINSLTQQDLNEGAKLMAMGINPHNPNYNDPNQVKAGTNFLMNREAIKTKNDQRLGLINQAQTQQTAISKNPDLYEPEDILAFNQWQSGSLDNAINTPMPAVRERFNPVADLVPKLDPLTLQTSKVVGNTKVEENKVLEEPTKANIETLISSTPQGNRWIKRATGLTVSEANNIPDTFEKNKADLEKQYKGNPQLREDLAKQGILPNTMEFDDYLIREAQANLAKKQAYNSIIDQYYGVAKAKANEFVKQNPDYSLRDQQLQEESAARARRGEQREITRFNERNDSKGGEAEIYRQQLINGMFSGVPGTGEELAGVIMGKGGYSKPVTYNTQIPGKLTITIPERVISKEKQKADGTLDYTETISPPRTVTFNTNNTADKLRLNQLINDITGETISPSKFISGNAGGKVAKGATQAPKSAPKSNKKSDPLGLGI